MPKNLVIVESPAKAKTIEKFLGKEYHVVSSYGHIRDLSEKGIGIDFEHNYQPKYKVLPDKKKLVSELKKATEQAELVWLASDEDREGEAIAWHLSEELKLPKEKTRRIVFHEITKDAIVHAIEHPRDLDLNLVDAQQARRVLDRIVGFELSPLLWKKIRPSLSAGRVQSVAVRLIVEREREINQFVPESSYRITAIFSTTDKDGKPVELKAELQQRFSTKEEAFNFLNQCKETAFRVENITTKPAKRSPAPPFTTSTLQQEAARKLGFSVSQTMLIAQHLYESGKITYMRTDSVNLSDFALKAAEEEINSMLGKRYWKLRHFVTKTKGAQEAHEAIRPTYMNVHDIEGSDQEKRLYDLIWKRTLASQMADAEFEKTTIQIGMENLPYQFVASGEVILFDGFLHLYSESTDDESDSEKLEILPVVNVGEKLLPKEIVAQERFTQRPPRYTEASLVRKLEELGIGRPSTYAPTISTIQNRKYIEKGNRPGEKRTYNILKLINGKISDQSATEITGAEKAKLFPTDIGIVVNDFLIEYFPGILSYNFTANVEKEFDEVATGKVGWTQVIDKFYKKFHPTVEKTLTSSERKVGGRTLGTDPKTGKPVTAKIGRYGPYVQIGTAEDTENPVFASLRPGQSIDNITLEEALDLFKLPREVGEFEGKMLTVAIGRFGPYIRQGNSFYSIPKGEDPLNISLERAIEIILNKREEEKKKIIKTLGENNQIQILNGRFGPYISFEKKNYKIPKNIDPAALTYEQCMEMIQEQVGTEKKGKKGNSKKPLLTEKPTKTAKSTKTAKTTKTSKTKKSTTATKRKNNT
ncbi:MAG TPA: type I DNA topoisomerase [Paludibacteraceae bacterium]|jgi:DNA topoisomerase-1|nr:type I DNA topoisomerase [Porphyromonadaceae sp. NP-X]HOH55173.1 type I DNA topoisomerase [Paludibacteraceae bacterium]